MRGHGDGEERQSEDDLFDLGSAFLLGARKAFERNRPNSTYLGLVVPKRPNNWGILEPRSRHERLNRWAREVPARSADPERSHSPRRSDSEAMLHRSVHDLEIVEFQASQAAP
jgi:hypothetical protein